MDRREAQVVGMIGFAGLSHLGLVSSIAAAAKGLRVVGYDPDPVLAEAVRGGRLPIHEAGLGELLESHQDRVTWTSDPKALGTCELIICSADSPTDAQHHSDLLPIEALLKTAAEQAPAGAVLVVLSQVPPGFTRRMVGLLEAHDWRALALFCQVETLIIGQAVERALRPERFIVGCRDPQQPLPAAYQHWLGAFGCPILRMHYESAELAKIAINTFLATSVSATNMLAELCEAVGADWSEVIPAVTSDRRIGPHAYVRPGLGLSGGNLERDLAAIVALSAECGTDAELARACFSSSAARRQWVLNVLHERVLCARPDPVIAVWGLAYKPGTASMKHAAALELLEALRGIAVRSYDPCVRLNGNWSQATQCSTALEACRGADALAILTPWPEFAHVPAGQIRELMRGRVIVDPFGVLDDAACAAAGLTHARLGAPLSEAEAH